MFKHEPQLVMYLKCVNITHFDLQCIPVCSEYSKGSIFVTWLGVTQFSSIVC